MDVDLLVPATAALLDGWVGPVATPDGPRVLIDYCDGDADGLIPCPPEALVTRRRGESPVMVDAVDLALDLSRAECRDRVARVLAGQSVPHAPLLAWWPPTEIGVAWMGLYGVEAKYITRSRECAAELCALNPEDDTRLPDGSRRVDALALAIVAREVLRG